MIRPRIVGSKWSQCRNQDMVLEQQPWPILSLSLVVGLFKERFDGGVKISLRATGDIDVQKIAKSFGGGGHVKAAGASIDHPLARSVELVEDCVKQALLAAGESGLET